MSRIARTIATPIAHLVGPGKIKVHNGRLAFSTGQGSPTLLDDRSLEQVLCYGDVGVSDEAFQRLFRAGVQVAWLSPSGHHMRGKIVTARSDATLLRVHQHRAAADPTTCLAIAKEFVSRKIESMLVAAEHYQKHQRTSATAFLGVARPLKTAARNASNLDALRGVEGTAASAWFAMLARLLPPDWCFGGRVRRPPTDPVNSLLSLAYTWLLRRTEAMLEAEGFEIQIGFLHAYRAGRPSLACDVMEPFRVPAVDRWVLDLVGRGQICLDDFVQNGSEVRLSPQALRGVLHSWENHWQTRSLRSALTTSVKELAARVRRLAHARDP